VDLLAAPSHLLTLISLAADLKVEFLNSEFLGSHSKGLSETPLYKKNSLVELDRDIPLIGVLSEEVRDGGIGTPAIVKAKHLLITIWGNFGYIKLLLDTRRGSRQQATNTSVAALLVVPKSELPETIC